MFIATVIVSLLLAAIALASASLKFRPDSAPARTIMSLGVPPSWLPRLAAAEIAGAVGLIVGLAWAPIGIAAAAGLVVYFVGAIVAHVRADDAANSKNAVLPLVLSIAALVLRIATA